MGDSSRVPKRTQISCASIVGNNENVGIFNLARLGERGVCLDKRKGIVLGKDGMVNKRAMLMLFKA